MGAWLIGCMTGPGGPAAVDVRVHLAEKGEHERWGLETSAYLD